MHLTLPEPDFNTERQLEDAIAQVARAACHDDPLALVVRGFGLDLAVFSSKMERQDLHLFEVKVFEPTHGRCGFGNQKGEGNQIRLLFDLSRNMPRAASELAIFDSVIRWILADRSKPLGSARYAFFTCAQASVAAANGVRPGKQNNFRISSFNDVWMTWPELMQRIELFLCNGTPGTSS